MSRIGKLHIDIPENTSVKVSGGKCTVTGPKGTLELAWPKSLNVTVDGQSAAVTRESDSVTDRSLHGLHRTLVANMIQGVSQGFTKKLEIQGVGYRAEVVGDNLVINVGYSHPITIKAREGVAFQVDKPSGSKGGSKFATISVIGINNVLVGQLAAEIRATRPPEPYKGKGIRYLGEFVARKVGKTAKA